MGGAKNHFGADDQPTKKACGIRNAIKKLKKKSKKKMINQLDLDIYENCKNNPENSARFNEKTIYIITEPGYTIKTKEGEPLFHVIAKLGSGGFSLVWLVYDIEFNEFKALKILKYGYGINHKEVKALENENVQNHQNMLKYHQYFTKRDKSNRLTYFAVYELLGKDLKMLMKEAPKNVGLSINVIKKVAKHILLALETLHNKCKFIHSDIKPENIAMCISQTNVYHQLKNIVEKGKQVEPLRMSCKKNGKINNENVRNVWKHCLDSFSKSGKEKLEEEVPLIFKLIDFGNVMNTGEHHTTGTYGYRPLEYLLGDGLNYSYDTWSLGVTIIELVINIKFVSPGKYDDESEMEKITKIFGKFPLDVFSELGLSNIQKAKYTSVYDKSNLHTFKLNYKNVLEKKIKKRKMSSKERAYLTDFLFRMLHYSPSKRMSAEELLAHPWLNDVA